jgi:hypothetical protein
MTQASAPGFRSVLLPTEQSTPRSHGSEAGDNVTAHSLSAGLLTAVLVTNATEERLAGTTGPQKTARSPSVILKSTPAGKLVQRRGSWAAFVILKANLLQKFFDAECFLVYF